MFYAFRGYRHGVLEFDGAQNLWKINLYTTNKTYATANVTDYPFGYQKWTIVNDPCFGEGEIEATLNLNACTNSEFNCMDGQCISMEKRCDGILDCDDKTGKLVLISLVAVLV